MKTMVQISFDKSGLTWGFDQLGSSLFWQLSESLKRITSQFEKLYCFPKPADSFTWRKSQLA